MKNKHDTVALDFQGRKVAIDKKIAPLIKEIWKCGSRTSSSCEDIGERNSDPDKLGVCLVQFVDVVDATLFLNAATVFERGGKSLFNRMSHCGCGGIMPWEYHIRPYDSAYDQIGKQEFYDGPADYGFLVSIYFPASDIETVMKNIASRSTRSHADDFRV